VETNCGFVDGDGVRASDLLVRLGPTLKVDLGFDPRYDGAKPNTLPVLPLANAWALIDTGASISAIDSGLAMDLQLPIIDEVEISGVGGTTVFNKHLAQIYVPSLNFTFFGSFAGVTLANGGTQHLALIGRDFLRHFVMTYDGPTGAVRVSDPV
jgi:hypothetical protein